LTGYNKVGYSDDVKGQAIAYLRVSTEEQVEKFSLDSQLDYCQKAAERDGFEIVKIFREEGESGKTLQRTQLIKLLDYCSQHKGSIDIIYVYRRDRLSRNTEKGLALETRLALWGIEVRSATEPLPTGPNGEFIKTITYAVAKLENDIRGLRTQDGMRKRFEMGYALTKAPLGYKNLTQEDGKRVIVKDSKTFDKMKKAWKLMETGAFSLEQITDKMNEMGLNINQKNSSKLRHTSVNRIFRNSFYISILQSRKWGQAKAKHEPMISDHTFYRVQAVLDGRNRSPLEPKRTINHPDFPLRRFIKCVCGASLTGGHCQGRYAKYPYYFCSSPKHKKKDYIPKETLENQFEDILTKLSPTKEFLRYYSAALEEEYGKRYSSLLKNRQKVDRQIQEWKELRQVAIQKNLKGVYDDEMFQEVKTKIENRIRVAQVVQGENLVDKYNIKKIINFLNVYIVDLRKTWLTANLEQRKLLFGSIFTKSPVWTKEGLLNHQISPIFQCLQPTSEGYISLGDPNGLWFEPILETFNKLMLAFDYSTEAFA